MLSEIYNEAFEMGEESFCKNLKRKKVINSGFTGAFEVFLLFLKLGCFFHATWRRSRYAFKETLYHIQHKRERKIYSAV